MAEVVPAARGPTRTMLWPPALEARARWAWLLHGRLRHRRLQALLSLLDGRVPRDAIVLDVGAGTGLAAQEFLRRFRDRSVRRRLVMDPQREMIRRAKRREGLREPPAADLVVGDATSLPVPEGSADVVLLVGVLCCLAPEAIPRAVAEADRVLKGGGHCLVSVPGRRGEVDTPLFLARGLSVRANPRWGWTVFQKGIRTAAL